ncbi:hypothetical protein [Chryseobacterium sp. P1-3]|uniref:hypothetical protein n=1 Tax=Chryseobacterium sp. (strain P1-3) TaxID=1517683 RepID=UPI000AD04FEA|nr:hypothetical protein [Chryseobacterium sp. P1-3]
MQTNKVFLIIFCLFSLAITCEKYTARVYNSNDQIENKSDNSFVLSCGSGCAMTYTLQSIQQNNAIVNVKFKVENYINEELSDTYYEKYNFIYNNLGEIERINLEGKNDNILETLMPDAQESFRNFSKSLIKNKKVDASKLSKVNETTIKNNFKVCSLPFDSDKYYSICNENEMECSRRYPSYLYPENKKNS